MKYHFRTAQHSLRLGYYMLALDNLHHRSDVLCYINLFARRSIAVPIRGRNCETYNLQVPILGETSTDTGLLCLVCLQPVVYQITVLLLLLDMTAV